MENVKKVNCYWLMVNNKSKYFLSALDGKSVELVHGFFCGLLWQSQSYGLIFQLFRTPAVAGSFGVEQ